MTCIGSNVICYSVNCFFDAFSSVFDSKWTNYFGFICPHLLSCWVVFAYCASFAFVILLVAALQAYIIYYLYFQFFCIVFKLQAHYSSSYSIVIASLCKLLVTSFNRAVLFLYFLCNLYIFSMGSGFVSPFP